MNTNIIALSSGIHVLKSGESIIIEKKYSNSCPYFVSKLSKAFMKLTCF